MESTKEEIIEEQKESRSHEQRKKYCCYKCSMLIPDNHPCTLCAGLFCCCDKYKCCTDISSMCDPVISGEERYLGGFGPINTYILCCLPFSLWCCMCVCCLKTRNCWTCGDYDKKIGMIGYHHVFTSYQYCCVMPCFACCIPKGDFSKCNSNCIEFRDERLGFPEDVEQQK